PTGTGTGNPGYRFVDEFAGFLYFDRPGLLAMANSGQPTTNGSQFFITKETTQLPTHLNYAHTIFGEVIEGQSVVEAIRLRNPQTDRSPGTGLNTVIIITDPSRVESSFARPDRASDQDVITAMTGPAETLADWPVLEPTGESGQIDLETLAGGAPSPAIEAFLETHNITLVVETGHENVTCDTSTLPVLASVYRLYGFESTRLAEAAITDETMADLAEAGSQFDYTERRSSEVLPYTLYQSETSACEVDAIRAMTYWQRGRFIAVVEVTLPATEAERADLWLDQVIGRRIYENALAEVLRLEMSRP
ncbi:hypothetical protein HC928_05510, partial [bacterium]|nr:hypothetical protein [bacterium]